MRRCLKTGLVLAVGLAGWAGCPVWAQTVERERESTITGPRGRSIQRSVTTQRGPGGIQREVDIKRPGGTFQSDTIIRRAGGMMPGGGGGFRPPFVGGGGFRPPFIGREIIVNNGGGGIGLAPALIGGAGLFGLGMLTGSALNSAPPPPVVVAQPPVVYAQPPVVVAQPGVVVAQPQPVFDAQPSPAPGPPPVDLVAQALPGLQSIHEHTRRDACLVLGRLHDPRAIPPLVDRLKNDWAKDVRVAAATALGELGDSRATVFLERATIYDKRQEVRDASAQSMARLSQPIAAPTTAAVAPTAVATGPRVLSIPEPTGENVPPPPRPSP